ncbi:MAG: putative transcriptional regulator [Phycisphaerales bacterium]|jgi:predicted transcriptional regulator
MPRKKTPPTPATPPTPPPLSRRERQIMDVIYERGRATAAEVREAIPDASSDSAIRTLLRILEEKGHLRHEKDGIRFVYLPKTSPDAARKTAMSHMVKTFFGGSSAVAAAALLDMSSGDLSAEDLDRLETLIDQAKREGK